MFQDRGVFPANLTDRGCCHSVFLPGIAREKWHFIVGLICASLRWSETEHLFIRFQAIHISLLWTTCSSFHPSLLLLGSTSPSLHISSFTFLSENRFTPRYSPLLFPFLSLLSSPFLPSRSHHLLTSHPPSS